MMELIQEKSKEKDEEIKRLKEKIKEASGDVKMRNDEVGSSTASNIEVIEERNDENQKERMLRSVKKAVVQI